MARRQREAPPPFYRPEAPTEKADLRELDPLPFDEDFERLRRREEEPPGTIEETEPGITTAGVRRNSRLLARSTRGSRPFARRELQRGYRVLG
jgi:hypothetical protein